MNSIQQIVQNKLIQCEGEADRLIASNKPHAYLEGLAAGYKDVYDLLTDADRKTIAQNK